MFNFNSWSLPEFEPVSPALDGTNSFIHNYVALLIHNGQNICRWFSTRLLVPQHFVSVCIKSSQKYAVLQNLISRTTNARYFAPRVWDIAITRVLGIIRVLQMPYIVSYQPYILHTLTDISYYEFWSVNEQFIISGVKITGLTKVRTVRLYNIWTFRVAKICKDRN
jgi:hypothetical protein